MKNPLKTLLATAGAAWAVALLVLLYQYSQNGRYQFRNGEGALVIDTRTGAIYYRKHATQQLELLAKPPR